MEPYPHAELTHEILGAAFAVHTALGPGFLEDAYERALAVELSERNIRFKRQEQVIIRYKNVVVDSHKLDLVVEDLVIVELKAIQGLASVHKAIVVAYLAATKLPVALLLNFAKPSLEYKRVIGGRS